METVAKFHKTEDAYLFRSYLESEGIPAFVFDENISQVFWHHTIAFGGVRVAVADDDADTAVALFKDYEKTITAGPSAVGDVKFWPFALAATLFLGVPFMMFGRKQPKPADETP